MQPSAPPAAVSVPGFSDAHAHLLKYAGGTPLTAAAGPVRAFHERVAAQRSTPMDEPDPAPDLPAGQLAALLRAGLDEAAGLGLTEVTEMGVPDWLYLDALAGLQDAGPLPLRVTAYLASGLASGASLAELAARRSGYAGPWLRLEGVKFYADGWLGPRTCAVCRDFADSGGAGVLFLDPPELARRIAPLAEAGWRIATHAIGDRAIAAVLDGYELAWGGDLAAIAAARPRIEHASLLSAELMARMAAAGVTACIQPCFAVTDAAQVPLALGPDRRPLAYPWPELMAAGVPVRAGSDFPIETLDPVTGLAALVTGPAASRLPAGAALEIMTDASSGQTMLSADPLAVAPELIGQITVTGTEPAAF